MVINLVVNDDNCTCYKLLLIWYGNITGNIGGFERRS